MLKQDSADPFRDGKQKHVVTECGRPIRHRETDVFAGDHSATANEEQCGYADEPRETVKPLIVAAVCDRRACKAP